MQEWILRFLGIPKGSKLAPHVGKYIIFGGPDRGIDVSLVAKLLRPLGPTRGRTGRL